MKLDFIVDLETFKYYPSILQLSSFKWTILSSFLNRSLMMILIGFMNFHPIIMIFFLYFIFNLFH